MNTNYKYIDMNQFPHNKNGTVAWKDSVGVIASFIFEGNVHKIEILDYMKGGRLTVRVDDNLVKTLFSNDIINLSFWKLLHRPLYRYDVGSIIGNIEILEQTKIERSNQKGDFKAYRCRCLIDGHIFIVSEYDLNDNHGCPLCANKIVVRGINDIATTNPEMVKYLSDKEDAFRYSCKSGKKINLECPVCGFNKEVAISSFYNNGFSCDICSDGISYSNKFAHEMFRQLFNQYIEYEYEYSPDWASGYLYDNYIKLLNNKEIIVEMDGAYHYIDRYGNNHDWEKNLLAENHGIKVIRVDCNYKKTTERFDHIKNNVIIALEHYFDLSSVDWNECNLRGVSSVVVEVAKYYTDNPRTSNDDVAKHFNICVDTLRNYLRIGEELGLCHYIRNNPDRIRTSKPIAIYDCDGNIIEICSSAKQVEENFAELKLYKSSVFRAAQNNKPYKGYIFKFVTYEEYQEFSC